MELLIGLALGALLGFVAGQRSVKQEGSRQQTTHCQQEAEPLEEQWHRVFAYEGYKSVREDEDA